MPVCIQDEIIKELQHGNVLYKSRILFHGHMCKVVKSAVCSDGLRIYTLCRHHHNSGLNGLLAILHGFNLHLLREGKDI